MAAAGDCVAGKYCLEYPLGEGGMGRVWRARHLQLDSLVAIKFQHERRASAPSATARFRHEARVAARIANPNVVRVVDFGVDAETPYLVMEYLNGESLRARLDRHGRLAVSEALGLAQQAADALDAVHDAGIIHRDLKPSNLFIVKEGAPELLKLIDFGIAKWSDASDGGGGLTTETGLVVGSVQYMSPEQARGERLDERADVWSLAVVAYQMLTGALPFQGANVPDTLRRICFGDHQRPSSWFGAGAAELDEVFRRAFARQPELRFTSATQFARELCDVGRALTSLSATSHVAPQSGGWAFGREGSTKTLVAPPLRTRRSMNKALVLIGASLSIAIAGGKQLLPSSDPIHSSPTGPSASPKGLAAERLAEPQPLAPELGTERPLDPLGTATAAVTVSVSRSRRSSRPQPSASIRPPQQEIAPAASRVDPVFGLAVPRGESESAAPLEAPSR